MADEPEVTEHLKTIEKLNQRGEALANDSAFITVRRSDWFEEVEPGTWKAIGEREKLHRYLLEQALEEAVGAKYEHRALIVSGAPGAGKSSLVKQVLGETCEDYLVIDADHFKELLLREAQADGSYEEELKPAVVKTLESQGEQFFPMDLASLVHEESSLLSARLRARCLSLGLNVVIDKVLASADSAKQLSAELQEAEYVIDLIEAYAPQAISEDRIVERWEQQQVASLEGEDDMGARWVPERFTEKVFDAPGHRSRPAEVAREFALACPAVRRFQLFHTALGNADDSQGAQLIFEYRRDSAGSALLRVR